MFNLRVFLLVLVLAIAAACSTGYRYIAPIPATPLPDRAYDVSFDEVWVAVLETVTDLEVPIENLEKASGFLRSDFMAFPDMDLSEFMDCGQEKARTPYYPAGSKTPSYRREWRPVTSDPTFYSTSRITVLVREDEEGRISVRLRALMTGASTSVVRGVPRTVTHNCESTGKWEALFFDEFEGRMTRSR